MIDVLDRVLIGGSSAMIRLRQDISRIAPTAIPVLLEGETGTGKELVAAAIHRLSARRGHFVPVNVAAIPETLFESQVFGHVRGAFTGAMSDHRGFAEEATAGTLFLDEVSAAPMAGQAKLLRVLESGHVRPVGARADRTTEFRLIAAANSSLHQEVRANRFRADLLYRICGDRVVLPPLRSRAVDIEPLARHFCSRLSDRLGRVTSLSDGAIRSLMGYEWPGNVRQLRTVVERAVVGAESDQVQASDILEVLERLAPTTSSFGPVSELAAELLTLLQKHSWDTVRVAAELGISRKTVYSRIQRYDLQIPGKYTRRAGVQNGGMGHDGIGGEAVGLSIGGALDRQGHHRGVA